MKLGVVWNPVSGRGSGAAAWPGIEARIKDIFPEAIFAATTGPDSASRQASGLVAAGCEIVAAAGGDGTVCGVAEALIGSPAALAVIPCGTGNDFARTIGIGTSMDMAIEALRVGRRQRIDVGRWETAGRSGHFLNVAGCGFDAAVADRVNKSFRSLRGRSAYLAAILATLLSYRATQFTILADGEDLSQRAMLCAIANAKSYGGGMLVAPTASLQDGLLDLVIVGNLGRFEFLRNFPKVLKGTHLSHPKVTHRRCRRVEIESHPHSPFLIDGELLPPDRVTVEVVPAALDVIMPAHTEK